MELQLDGLLLASFFFFYCTQLQAHFWPAIFLSKDLTKWLHRNLSCLCFESQSAAVVTPARNERLFKIIKWIDQRSLHVQKCNDMANEIVPLLPSQRSNYIVSGHGGLTEMGIFSMAHIESVSPVVWGFYIIRFLCVCVCEAPQENTSFLFSLLHFPLCKVTGMQRQK